MARKIRTTKSPEERRAEAEGLHAHARAVQLRLAVPA